MDAASEDARLHRRLVARRADDARAIDGAGKTRQQATPLGVRAGETARREGSSYFRDYATELPKLAAQGVMRPHISHRFPLDRVADAMRVLIDRQAIGKVVIEIA